jgi:hypothetical protein|tara:strand:+ start:401 stop:679 length:279 start_codon:yes stop_codon:yes gene_type:complete
MQNTNYTFHSDAGHAWLQVTLSELKELNIMHKISHYSYLDDKNAYLEEDCDCSVFLNAKKEKNQDVDFTELHTDNDHFIRDFKSFTGVNYEF